MLVFQTAQSKNWVLVTSNICYLVTQFIKYESHSKKVYTPFFSRAWVRLLNLKGYCNVYKGETH